MRNVLALALALWPLTLAGASAADCAAPFVVEAPLDGSLQPTSRVENLQITLQSCRREGAEEVLATRSLRIGGEELFVAVDPEQLATRLERAACWTCKPTTAEAQLHTRFIGSVERLAREPGKALAPGATWLDNAGLKSGRGGGAFLSGDLCPSHRPLDRAFLKSLEQGGAATPIALSITGRWMEQHVADFLWLRQEKAQGRLAISFVNHSFHHPYRPGVSDAQNFLLVPGVDMTSEILDVERLLIANGEIPSVFFRFPGLISDRALMERVREAHLIPLGADAWLALGAAAHPGAIILVHPNGNEPLGLSDFARLRGAGRLPQPFRPIDDAP
ncbi:polysaccharide deacetylase [Rhodoblastus sp. 17X3]|uniref:polysaccharide deacetylase family protein n=1 Tax=Rhodoblastus sp. 17X3 TaxID=3047026 RepID=UPI0024B65E3B|nr:polysaccharide deacetylase [Rhodoblastus sp. 17X3]MDI9849339.1 polysaccharide deacetylase [Rhodoblastus sp. 17X3]